MDFIKILKEIIMSQASLQKLSDMKHIRLYFLEQEIPGDYVLDGLPRIVTYGFLHNLKVGRIALTFAIKHPSDVMNRKRTRQIIAGRFLKRWYDLCFWVNKGNPVCGPVLERAEFFSFCEKEFNKNFGGDKFEEEHGDDIPFLDFVLTETPGVFHSRSIESDVVTPHSTKPFHTEKIKK
jgi:hypothetical protein